MEKEIRKVMSERTDEELEIILTTDRKSYNPEAIQAAEEEIKKRNIIIDESKIVENKKSTTPKLTPKRKAFNNRYGELTESEIQKEILFTQRLALDKLYRIRKNTSILVWFLIVLPIIIGILFAIFN